MLIPCAETIQITAEGSLCLPRQQTWIALTWFKRLKTTKCLKPLSNDGPDFRRETGEIRSIKDQPG